MPEINRRRFINLVGRTGGAAAICSTLSAMGILAPPVHYRGLPRLLHNSGRGVRIAVLGAGIAGMTAARELRKAGYDCTILEARDRPGGRIWTIRGGDTIAETDSSQRVAWDRQPDLYLNAGPARISQHHQGILSYCRELRVPLEVIVNDNRAALLQDDAAFGGEPQLARRVNADTRGWIAALAAGGLGPAARQSVDDRNLRTLLRSFGALNDELLYTGSARAGYAQPPGVTHQQPGRLYPPLPLGEISKAASWRSAMVFAETGDQAGTMMQPVGGMDALARAFAQTLGPMIKYQAEVVRLRLVGERARVSWRDRSQGAERSMDADFVICTIPLPVLKGIESDFSAPVKRAIEVGANAYVPAVKVAFQAKRRWWETDQQIYGGISWTSRDISQLWYPSAGLNGDRGILIGAYIWTTSTGKRFAAMTPEKRHAAAIADGEHLHPGYGHLVGKGASVAWSKVPFTGGAWADWSDAAWRDAYPTLLNGQGPFYFAGEHMSYMNGWLEGAVRSAHDIVERIAARVRERAS
jgi:monoamine oxidase